jgi:plastocyanin
MKRRQFLKGIGFGSAAMVTAAVAASRATAQEHVVAHEPVLNGPLASATVSFGAWPVGGDPPLDRAATPDAPIAPNLHELLPNTVRIKVGGAVSYIIAGFHQIVVYEPGKKPSDVDTGTLIPIPNAPPTVGLIDDPERRLYRGANPIGLLQDRVEVVHFSEPGLYLVICSVNVHFADNMYGWVMVLR